MMRYWLTQRWGELKMPAVILLITDCDHDPGWFAGLDNHHARLK